MQPDACCLKRPTTDVAKHSYHRTAPYQNRTQGPASRAVPQSADQGAWQEKKQKGGCTSRDVPTPLAQKCPGHRRLSGEDGHGNGPIAGGQVIRTPGNDIVAVQALVLDALIAQKLSQTASSGDGTALAALVLIQSLAHGAGLTDEAEQLIMRQVHSLQSHQTRVSAWSLHDASKPMWRSHDYTTEQ